ncbi:MAG: DUF4397 domain-containing protein [Thermomicrobiales bacterium]
MGMGTRRVLRTSLYGVALAALLLAIILPTVAAKSNPPFRVRVLMAVADNSGVDVWIDDVQLTNNAQFKTLSAYVQREEGDYELSVYPAGKKSQSAAYVYKRVVPFRAPKDYTIVVMGKQADNSIDASIEIDRNTLDGSNNAHVRLGDYIAGTGTLTLATAVSNTVLGNAKSGETDAYVSIAAGTYTLILNDANNALVTKTDNVTLGPNTAVSVFAVGLGKGTPGPSLIVNTDAGTPPVQATATPTATTAPSPSAPVPAASPASAASAALRQAFLPVPSVANTSDKVYYPQTGHTLGGIFKTYWEQHGGLAQFGYPITEEYSEVSLTDGKTYVTQYFERARFENHPENKGTQYEVLQGLLGREMIKLLGVG